MGTNTAKHNLYRPTIDETGWGALVNANCDVIDKLPYLKKGANVTAESALFTAAAYPTDGNYFDITGTTTILSIITSGVIGTMIALHFNEILIIEHTAFSLDLPGGSDITTSVGSELVLVEESSGNWRCISDSLASTAVIAKIVCNDNQVVCNDNTVVIN